MPARNFFPWLVTCSFLSIVLVTTTFGANTTSIAAISPTQTTSSDSASPTACATNCTSQAESTAGCLRIVNGECFCNVALFRQEALDCLMDECSLEMPEAVRVLRTTTSGCRPKLGSSGTVPATTGAGSPRPRNLAGAIAGGVIGGVIAATLGTLGVVVHLRRKRRLHQVHPPTQKGRLELETASSTRLSATSAYSARSYASLSADSESNTANAADAQSIRNTFPAAMPETRATIGESPLPAPRATNTSSLPGPSETEDDPPGIVQTHSATAYPAPLLSHPGSHTQAGLAPRPDREASRSSESPPIGRALKEGSPERDLNTRERRSVVSYSQADILGLRAMMESMQRAIEEIREERLGPPPEYTG